MPVREVTQRVTYGPVIAAITQLLDAGNATAPSAPAPTPGDFLQLAGTLWRAATGPEDRSQPMLGLVLDGLSPRPPR